MDERHEALARRFKEGLEAIYGPRLRGVYACQDDDEDGQGIATVVVLDDEKSARLESDRVAALASDLIIETGMALTYLRMSAGNWRAAWQPASPALRPVA